MDDKKNHLTSVSSANLTFWTWYAVETDWDYGYVAVYSGNKWTNLQGTLTTNNNPNVTILEWNDRQLRWMGAGNHELTPFAGKDIYLGFRFQIR